jgi:peptidoglycan/xylan/chitin deacetylase (PgdA/CDA1 family)
MPDLRAIRRRARPWLVLMTMALALALVSGRGSGTASTPRAEPAAPTPTPAPADARPAAQPPLDRGIAAVMRRTEFVSRGGGRRREIALTFDDGPGPYTPAVLASLNRLDVQATFFVVGRQQETFRAAMMAAIGRGHVIGDHTQGHRRLAALPAAEQFEELLAPLRGLEQYGLPRPQLFRPPYGSYDAITLDALRYLGMLMVLWSIDSKDYERPGVEQIVDRVVSAARPGAIVLMHDGGGDRTQTIAAIPRIVRRLRAKRYRLVTVPQLLRDDPPSAVPRPPQLPIDER